MHGYSVREYAFLSVIYNGCPKSSLDHAYIPQTAFEYLCGLAASFSKSGAKIFEIAGRKKLKLDQYVGVIETPAELVLKFYRSMLNLKMTVKMMKNINIK